jgi:hypothetical protein
MVVKQATPGQYFDVDTPLSGAQAAEFVKAGMLGCIRYFPLNASNVPGCLTALELPILLSSGLAVAAVQHVDSSPWTPTEALGAAHGAYAGAYAKAIGYAAVGAIFCDLEEVAAGTTAQQVIDYCTAWFEQVTTAGFSAGLYVGWNVALSDSQLYDLPVKSYWSSYNCDQSIPTRGWQIRQHTQKTLNGITYDPNTVQKDELGDLPMFLLQS